MLKRAADHAPRDSLQRLVRCHIAHAQPPIPDGDSDNAAQSASRISKRNKTSKTWATRDPRVGRWNTVSHWTHRTSSLRLPLQSKDNSHPPKKNTQGLTCRLKTPAGSTSLPPHLGHVCGSFVIDTHHAEPDYKTSRLVFQSG